MIYLMIELCNLFKVTEWLTLFYDLGNKADVVLGHNYITNHRTNFKGKNISRFWKC